MYTEEAQALVHKLFPYPDQFGTLVGYRLNSINLEERTAHVTLRTDEKHRSPSGAVHGGVLSTLVDYAMGAAIFGCLKEGHLCSTIEFKLNYLAPVQVHDLIHANAHVLRLGRSHAIVETKLNVNEKIVVTALGTYNIYKPRRSAEES
jgi:uncharacterized protein (TIGR00369 family)